MFHTLSNPSQDGKDLITGVGEAEVGPKGEHHGRVANQLHQECVANHLHKECVVTQPHHDIVASHPHQHHKCVAAQLHHLLITTLVQHNQGQAAIPLTMSEDGSKGL